MAKVHITLVGGQPAPVYKGIIDEQPDKVILVCSNDSVGSADNVQKYACEKIKGLQCEKVLLSPISIPETKEKMIEIASSVSNGDTMTVNISGGTKVWSVLFYDFFKDKAECFFIDQNDNKYNFSSGQTTKIDVEFGIKESLLLNDIRVSGMHLLSEYNEEDFRAIATVREMRQFSPGNFSKLMTQIDNGGPKFLDESNYLSYDKERGSYRLVLSTRRGSKNVEIYSPHVRNVMLKTGWFELEVAKLLGEWVPPQQVAMNCLLSSSKNVNGLTLLNEIDIIVYIAGKLLFVECKTQIAKGEATTIDKFNNAIRSYGGLSAKGVFFTDVAMKDQAKAKCEKANILTFNMQEIKEAGYEGKKDLFKKLDKHIGGLNIR